MAYLTWEELLKISKEDFAAYYMEHSNMETAVYFNISDWMLTRYCRTFSLHKTREQQLRRYRDTCLRKYGVDNVKKVPEIQRKAEKTCLSRYGYKTNLLTEYNKQQLRKCLKSYGVDNIRKSPIISQKIEATNLAKYGVRVTSQAQSVKQKAIETFYKHWGVDNPMKHPEIVAKLSRKMSSPEIQDKICDSKRRNNSFSKSAPEDIFYTYLCTKYDINDVERQYKEERYPFRCDFYIKSKDLFIELNLHWTHGGMPFDENNIKCQQQLAEWKQKAQTSKFYQTAVDVWTGYDIKKQAVAKEHKLNYRTFYTIEEAKSGV